MESGEPGPTAARSRWTSPVAVTGYVLVVALVVVATFWAARTGRADTSTDPGAGASTAPSDAGTPRITISLTPTWQSAAQPTVAGGPRLVAEPADMAAPVVLAGSADEGYARLDPATGAWVWRRDTGGRTFLGWAGSTALFGGSGGAPNERVRGKGWVTHGISPEGVRVFTAHAGRYVTSTQTRVLLADGRDLTALTPTGRVAWRSTLPAGVTVPGHVPQLPGRGPTASAPVEAVFVSSSGPGRVATVDLVDGVVRALDVDADRPEAWSTPSGVLVADPAVGSVTRYDLSGSRAWSLEEGLDLLDVRDGVALVAARGTETVSLLRIHDGSTVWTSDPLDGEAATGAITISAAGAVLTSLTFGGPGSGPPVVLAADPTTGEQLWAVQRRNLLGTWHGFALFAATDSRALSALDLRTGISYATLNASTVVDPSAAVISGSTLIYLDPAATTARAVALADRL